MNISAALNQIQNIGMNISTPGNTHIWVASILFMCLTSVVQAQVLIETSEGQEYKGTILDENNESLTLAIVGGDTLTFAFSEITFMDRSGKGSQAPKKHIAMGFHAGTPSYSLNFDIGVYTPHLHLRFSGGWFVEPYGFQVDVGYPIHHSTNLSVDTYLALGYSNSFASDKWKYVGIGGNIRTYVFFLSGGINVGQGDLTNPSFLVQLGIMWEIPQ